MGWRSKDLRSVGGTAAGSRGSGLAGARGLGTVEAVPEMKVMKIWLIKNDKDQFIYLANIKGMYKIVDRCRLLHYYDHK